MEPFASGFVHSAPGTHPSGCVYEGLLFIAKECTTARMYHTCPSVSRQGAIKGFPVGDGGFGVSAFLVLRDKHVVGGSLGQMASVCLT